MRAAVDVLSRARQDFDEGLAGFCDLIHFNTENTIVVRDWRVTHVQ
jgi:hypothetical protein